MTDEEPMSEVNNLLIKIAEPETPEERDAAWNEVAGRLHYLNEIMEVIDRVKQYPDPDPAARARRVIGHLKNEAMLERTLRAKAEALVAALEAAP